MLQQELIKLAKNEIQNQLEHPRYSCSNYKCHKSIKGNYDTLEKCQTACKAEPYSCNADTGQCSLNPKGKFPTLDDCNKHCSPKYKCHTNVDGTTECIIAHDGKYKSVKECQDKCKPKYICHRDEKNQPSCKISAKGNFKSLTECQTKCQPLFACDPISNTCHYSAKGKYSSIENCQIGCAPNYTCDKKSYTCIPQHSGPYSTVAECSEQCRPPILLPKENITEDALNKQLQVKSTMDGSLQSETLRYNSTILEYLTYAIITITIVALIYYYAAHNTNTVLGTAIAIITAILVIFVIAKYIYEHYNSNTGAFRVQ